MNSNIFVCQLSKKNQNKIRKLITKHFTEEGYTHSEIKDIIESVMENRLWNIEEVININILN